MIRDVSSITLAAGIIHATIPKIRIANDLPSPTDPDELAARGNYLPYTGYFEETYSADLTLLVSRILSTHLLARRRKTFQFRLFASAIRRQRQ